MPASLALPESLADEDLIDWGLAQAQRPLLTTKFGPDSAVLLHMVTRRRPRVPVVWVDSGYNTRQTLVFAEQLSRQLDLDLRVYRPQAMVWEDVPALDDPGHAEFTRRIKLEPFERALQELQPDVWFTALRREQTSYRAGQPAVRTTPRGYLKIAPLLDWRDADMQDYLRRHGLPRGPACYDPTKGEARRECGLHLVY